MAILRAEHLKKTFGTRTLFSDVSFEIQPNERVGLIGVNGSGKTTLFRMLLGQESIDSGFVGTMQGTRIACVEQQPKLLPDLSLYSFTLEAYRELLEMEAELQRIEEALQSGEGDRDRRILRQSVLLEQFLREGGQTFRAMTRSALLGVGFSESDFSRSVLQFSGGQISKVMLVRAILQKADLLLLDEPTNNLDVAAIRWLEEFLKQYRGAVLVVSHDRAFLDATVTRMLELTHEKMLSTIGNYTRYQELKLSNRERAEKVYQRQCKEIRRIEGIIAQQKRWNQERNYVTIASKQKQIDRIRAEMVAPDGNEQSIRFRFPEPAPTGNEVIRLSNLGKSFGEKHLFSHVDLLIRKQECVCLIGANGCGKTTLLKILCGMERQSEGDYRLGAGVRIGYYSQHTRDLHEEKTVMQEMDDAFPLIPHNTLRGYLGMFLFRGDEIEKPISALSGGEKARIRLLKLVLSGANVLLLDEPTNHLDIASAEVLEKAIEQFSGTVLIVSHDRYLIDRLADRVLLLEQDGIVEQADEQEDLFERIRPPKATKPTVERSEKENHYQKQKEAKQQKALLKQRMTSLERDILRVEAEVSEVQEQITLSQEKNAYEQMQTLFDRLSKLQQQEESLYEQLEQAETDWLAFSEETV